MDQDLFPHATRLWHVILGPRTLVLLIAVAAMTSACAATSTIPRTPQDDCERWGGVWRGHLGFCEYQGDSPK